jgi:hypothetical protein
VRGRHEEDTGVLFLEVLARVLEVAGLQQQPVDDGQQRLAGRASSSSRSMMGSSVLPGGVSPVSRLPARVNISTPSSSSSSRICRLMAGWEVKRTDATSVRL